MSDTFLLEHKEARFIPCPMCEGRMFESLKSKHKYVSGLHICPKVDHSGDLAFRRCIETLRRAGLTPMDIYGLWLTDRAGLMSLA